MSSTFNNQSIFDSGPHRFSIAPLGEYVLRNAVIDPFQAGSQPIGPLDLIVTVRGRLIADSAEDLWAIRDAIAQQLTNPVTSGPLKEHDGRTWDAMSFVSFTAADRTDRGRQHSLAYTATFIRFI